MVQIKTTLTKRVTPGANFHMKFLEEFSGVKASPRGFEAFIQNDLKKTAELSTAHMRGILHRETRYSRGTAGLIGCATTGKIKTKRIGRGKRFSIGIFDRKKAESLPRHKMDIIEAKHYSKSEGITKKKPSGETYRGKKGYWRILEFGMAPHEITPKQLKGWIGTLKKFGLYDENWRKTHKRKGKTVKHPGVKPIRFIQRTYEFGKNKLAQLSPTALERYKYTRQDYVRGMIKRLA
jgi:hypothetical protein